MEGELKIEQNYGGGKNRKQINAPNIKKMKFKYKLFNFILYEIFLILLSKINISFGLEHYIEIKVNKKGNNQILSDKYVGTLPSEIYINGNSISMNNKKVNVESIDNIIRLKWTNTISNYSYMFSNLYTITSVHMNYMFGQNNSFAYMFYNCYNLKSYTYDINYDKSHGIINMTNMFYNCTSLISFQFNNLYMDYYHYYQTQEINSKTNKTYNVSHYNYHYINMSNMFYNCQNLKLINVDNKEHGNIKDMREMFYNCFSLTSLNLINFTTDSYIDLSYMFYNCSNLKYFENVNSHFSVGEMQYMFYNCILLESISLSNFHSSYYYINMSKLFYNCYNLITAEGFSDLDISDTDQMFYNCTSLISLNFKIYNIIEDTNMSKIFYNCIKIKTIIFDIYYNHYYNIKTTKYFNPNNLNSTFYNCISLQSVKFNSFKTDYTKEITYMFYNCKKLISFSMYNSSFTNKYIINMRGMFQNCESLVSLNLQLFYTPNVEIMWDMFKGCKKLNSLNIDNFDTSKVTDMESMFEGCSSLVSLSLIHFNTSKVRYMNKMFRDCTSLQSLYFNKISSDSLGTMQQMFYNCKSLKYLNIFSLTENAQTISEIFEGASNDFSICIKEHENISNIFMEFFNKERTYRDCSDECYGTGNNRTYIPEKKICCPKFKYNDTCYDKCPSRMKAANDDKICKYFNCLNSYYYNYEQDDCINTIPVGFYCNDTNLKTIDKCNKVCKTCNQGSTITKANCLTCSDDYPYFFFGNCLKSCENGYKNKNGFLECNCVTEECSDCT